MLAESRNTARALCASPFFVESCAALLRDLHDAGSDDELQEVIKREFVEATWKAINQICEDNSGDVLLEGPPGSMTPAVCNGESASVIWPSTEDSFAAQLRYWSVEFVGEEAWRGNWAAVKRLHKLSRKAVRDIAELSIPTDLMHEIRKQFEADRICDTALWSIHPGTFFGKAAALYCFGFTDNCIEELISTIEWRLRQQFDALLPSSYPDRVSLGNLLTNHRPVLYGPSGKRDWDEPVEAWHRFLSAVLTESEMTKLSDLYKFRSELVHRRMASLRKYGERDPVQQEPHDTHIVVREQGDVIESIVFSMNLLLKVDRVLLFFSRDATRLSGFRTRSLDEQVAVLEYYASIIAQERIGRANSSRNVGREEEPPS